MAARALVTNQKAKRGNSSKLRRVLTDQEIYERILTAIIEHKLPPGTKLGEEKLAAAFAANRARVRQVLARLAHENIVTLERNRGAFVSSPSVEEAREIFEFRRLIEPPLVGRVAELATNREITRLRQHVTMESEARTANDRGAIIRLSGEFHMLLADMTGNSLVIKNMRELASLTCLIITLYDSPAVPACPTNEHSELVDAIAARGSEQAANLMVEHLRHVENCLSLETASSDAIDLELVFK